MHKKLNHLGIIMDGNGRWATARGLSRTEGHKAGAKTVTRVLEACQKRGIHYVTLYAFSTENWKRPAAEVAVLMDLFKSYLDKDVAELQKKDIRIHFIGDRTRFTAEIQQQMKRIEEATRGDEAYHLILALSYSGRDELVRAMRRFGKDVQSGLRNPDDLTEEAAASYLDTAGLPDPDLIVRTSGEQRLSNFLLWQMAYAELYFTPVLWPDFSESDLDAAIDSFQKRERRFGTVTESPFKTETTVS